MKIQYFLLWIAAFICCNTFSQPLPTPDTLQLGVMQVDSLSMDTVECYPYLCEVQKCHAWQLPLNFSGLLDLGSDNPNTYEIIIISNNDTVRFDRCDSITPFSQGLLQIFYNYGQNAQVIICGPADAQIFIAAKTDPDEHKPLPFPILLLDTLCKSLATMQTEPQKPLYWELPNFILTDQLQPNRAYKVARKEENQQ